MYEWQEVQGMDLSDLIGGHALSGQDICTFKERKRKTKAYLYIFYTAFIGSAIEVCIKKKFVHFDFIFFFFLFPHFFVFFQKKKKSFMESLHNNVALIHQMKTNETTLFGG